MGDVKINQAQPSNTAAAQGMATVRGPDLLGVSQPFRTPYLLVYGSRSLSNDC